jgi:hypothetical protein
MKHTSVLLALALCGVALAQSDNSKAFPDGASAATAAELQQRLADKTFNVKLGDGTSWHVEYKSSGSFVLTTSSGFSDNGQWTIEEGKICGKGRKIGSSCNEARLKDGAIFLKRDNGDVVQFVEQN